MAQMKVEGLEELIRDLGAAVAIPDDTASEILNAQADVLIREQREEIGRRFPGGTGQLAQSLANVGMKKDGTTRYVDVYPQGTRKRKRTTYRQRAGRYRSVTNTEVGFIQEYGAPGRHIAAAKWMEKAEQKARQAMAEAGRAVYDKFLKTRNL